MKEKKKKTCWKKRGEKRPRKSSYSQSRLSKFHDLLNLVWEIKQRKCNDSKGSFVSAISELTDVLVAGQSCAPRSSLMVCSGRGFGCAFLALFSHPSSGLFLSKCVLILLQLRLKIQKVGFASGIKLIKTGYSSSYFRILSLPWVYDFTGSLTCKIMGSPLVTSLGLHVFRAPLHFLTVKGRLRNLSQDKYDLLKIN